MTNQTHHNIPKSKITLEDLSSGKDYEYHKDIIDKKTGEMKRLPWNEELFLMQLMDLLDDDSDDHIEYAEAFLKRNNIPCPAKDYRERIALEYCTIYLHFLVVSMSNANLLWKSALIDEMCDQFLLLFEEFDPILEDYELDTLWVLYKKRSMDIADLINEQEEELVDTNNEMNFRRIFITEPFANINFLEPTKVDPDLTRAIENSIYFNSTFMKISTNAQDYVDRYLVHPNKKDDPRRSKK